MKKFFIFLTILVLLNCKKESNKDLIIDIISMNANYYIGKENGIIAAWGEKTISGVFNRSDMEEKTQFDMELTCDSNETYALNCRLWLGDEDRIILFCNFNESLNSSDYIGKALITSFANYYDYNLVINFHINNMVLYKLDYNIPFLYSAPININVDQQSNKISFDLKIDSYNEEPLFVRAPYYRVVRIEKCEKKEKTLKCEIPKENIDVIATTETTLEVIYINDFKGWNTFEFVSPIKLTYTGVTKENVYFKLEKLQENIVDISSYVTFSTNVTNLPILKTNTFNLYFSQDVKTECFYIKPDKSQPLYITCYASKTLENFVIGEMNGFTKDNIHYKYNFILAPGRSDDKISIREPKGSYIIHTFPEILDYSKSGSDIDVYFAVESVDGIRGIRLNVDKNDLECQDIVNIKKCKVPKSHFEGKTGGYYPIRHINNNNVYAIDFETLGIQVKLGDSPTPGPTPGPGGSGKFNQYSFGLLALLSVLIL